MLTAIKGRDSELTQHRENLTELVQQRTAELERKTKEALAASVAKSDFLANMSHEIRTPLNAIMGYADLLRSDWNHSTEERDEMLETVVSSGRHLMTVIHDILDLSKIEAGHIELELQPNSPHSVLSEVVSLMRVPFREKDLTLDYNWEGQVPETIKTDGAPPSVASTCSRACATCSRSASTGNGWNRRPLASKPKCCGAHFPPPSEPQTALELW